MSTLGLLITGGMMWSALEYVSICTLKHLKEELAWAIDKQLQLIINTMLGYTTKNLKNKAIFVLKQYCMHCYVTLSNIF